MVCDAGRYQVISASGKTLPILQGLWTGTNHVPWSGDYTRNGNEQTVILSNLPGNMFECMDSFISYEESLVPEERENARVMYRLSGHFKRLPHQQPWAEQPFQRGMAHDVLDHRRRLERPLFLRLLPLYHGQGFLLNHALPYMKECIVFLRNFSLRTKTASGCLFLLFPGK